MSTIVRTSSLRAVRICSASYGLAEEAPVDPGPRAVGHVPDAEDEDDGERQVLDAPWPVHPALTGDGAGHEDGDGDRGHLKGHHSAAGQRVLQALPDDHAHVHRAMDDDHVGEAQRKEEHREERGQHDPVRGDRVRAAGDQAAHDEECGRRQPDGGARMKQHQAAPAVGGGGRSALEAQDGEERSDRDHREDDRQRLQARDDLKQARDRVNSFHRADRAHRLHDGEHGQRADEDPLQPREASVERQPLRKRDREEQHPDRPRGGQGLIEEGREAAPHRPPARFVRRRRSGELSEAHHHQKEEERARVMRAPEGHRKSEEQAHHGKGDPQGAGEQGARGLPPGGLVRDQLDDGADLVGGAEPLDPDREGVPRPGGAQGLGHRLAALVGLPGHGDDAVPGLHSGGRGLVAHSRDPAGHELRSEGRAGAAGGRPQVADDVRDRVRVVGQRERAQHHDRGEAATKGQSQCARRSSVRRSGASARGVWRRCVIRRRKVRARRKATASSPDRTSQARPTPRTRPRTMVARAASMRATSGTSMARRGEKR